MKNKKIVVAGALALAALGAHAQKAGHLVRRRGLDAHRAQRFQRQPHAALRPRHDGRCGAG